MISTEKYIEAEDLGVGTSSERANRTDADNTESIIEENQSKSVIIKHH